MSTDIFLFFFSGKLGSAKELLITVKMLLEKRKLGSMHRAKLNGMLPRKFTV